jgi:hypothetical protein
MSQNQLKQQVEAYHHWKTELINAIDRFNEWMNQQDFDESHETALRIYEAVESLKKDRLTLAFVAEFSRGKTELINAIFFSDYKCRLLPSEAGRTTMCPTELFYDEQENSAYLKLLPIESRLDERSIQEFKEEPVEWTRISLDVESPEKMQETLKEIIRTREVSIKKATRLGLFSEELHPHLRNADPETTLIEIPAWRHAMISFPHPLLKQGLSILDTPGLNALGSEPELTLKMLPAAQAVLFILAADTGVTRSDLDIWQHHINQKGHQSRGVAVILNKIDTLWDDLKSTHQINHSISEQIHKTSQLLAVDKAQIFPLSAQKGLLAKINNDDSLLKRSQLEQVENYLANQVLPARGTLLRDNIVSGIGHIIEEHQQVFESRLETVNKQLDDLRQLNGKNIHVITQLMKKTRMEQMQHSKHTDAYKSSSRLLKRQVDSLKNILNLRRMDEIIHSTRESMTTSWTTGGMKQAMKNLFTEVSEMTAKASDEVDNLHRLVNAVYRKFNEDHGINCQKPKAFKVKKYLIELENLYVEAENYRKSPVSTMSEQNFVIKRFFINMVSQARNIMYKGNEDLDNWLHDAMRPLALQIKENKRSIEKRLLTLRKISESKGNVEDKTKELETEHSGLKAQLDEITLIYQQLEKSGPAKQLNQMP